MCPTSVCEVKQPHVNKQANWLLIPMYRVVNLETMHDWCGIRCVTTARWDMCDSQLLNPKKNTPMLHPFQVEMMLYYPILRCIIILSWRGCSSIWGCFCRGAAGTRVHHLIYCISPRKGYSTLPSPQNVQFPGNFCFDIAKIPRALGVLGEGEEQKVCCPFRGFIYKKKQIQTQNKTINTHGHPCFFKFFSCLPFTPFTLISQKSTPL